MGKFTIVSNLGEGRYRVQQEFDYSGIQERIDLLTAENVEHGKLASDLYYEVTVLKLDIRDATDDITRLLDRKPPAVKEAQELTLETQRKWSEMRRLEYRMNMASLKKKANEKTIENLRGVMEQTSAVRTALCIDGTDDLSGTVASIELNRYPFDYTYEEGEKTVLLRPSGSSSYVAARDGIVQPAVAMTPSALFVNQAVLSSAQAYIPRYVAGQITGIDSNGKASVSLLVIPNYNPATWWQGAAPVKLPYELPTGSVLSGVEVKYLDCDAGAFTAGDKVVIEYANGSPRVIGFTENPKECGGQIVAVFYPVNFSDEITFTTGTTTASITVDWGDGVPASYSGSASGVPVGVVNFSAAGAKGFRVYGDNVITARISTYSGIYRISGLFSGSKKLSAVEFTAQDMQLNDITSAFANCNALTVINGLDTSLVTNFSSAFYGCWNISDFTWVDTSSATTLHNAFYQSGMTSIPSFDLSNCTALSGAFNGTKITTVPNLDTSKVTTFATTFYNCESLIEFDADWDTSSGLYFNGMFDGCHNLRAVGWFDTSKATTLSRLYHSCSSLPKVPEFSIDATPILDDMFGYSAVRVLPFIDTTVIPYEKRSRFLVQAHGMRYPQWNAIAGGAVTDCRNLYGSDAWDVCTTSGKYWVPPVTTIGDSVWSDGAILHGDTGSPMYRIGASQVPYPEMLDGPIEFSVLEFSKSDFSRATPDSWTQTFDDGVTRAWRLYFARDSSNGSNPYLIYIIRGDYDQFEFGVYHPTQIEMYMYNFTCTNVYDYVDSSSSYTVIPDGAEDEGVPTTLISSDQLWRIR